MNETVLIGILALGALLAMLAMGVWVGIALLIAGIIAIFLTADVAVFQVAATTYWSSLNSWSLAALPLYIWMGEILFRSGMSEQLFSAIAPWLRRVPGRLLHSNIIGSGIFATVCGSSAATCLTIGKITVPALKKRGYAEGIAIGSLAGAGTLGLLIPPSIVLIVYGVAVDESIARLFAAGLLPGVLVAVLFMLYVAFWAWRNPELMPPADVRLPYRERFRLALPLIPLIALITALILSIYTGIASPTDAAAVGVFLSFVLVACNRRLSMALVRESLVAATITTSMILLIVAGAAILTIGMAYSGVPRTITAVISEYGLSKYALLAVLTVIFILLGMFLEGISLILLTSAIIMPAVVAAGVDKVWFGIFLVIIIETAQITPPVGFNLFVLQTLTGRSIGWLALQAFPFFMVLLTAIVLITVFPEIVMFLPNAIYQ